MIPRCSGESEGEGGSFELHFGSFGGVTSCGWWNLSISQFARLVIAYPNSVLKSINHSCWVDFFIDTCLVVNSSHSLGKTTCWNWFIQVWPVHAESCEHCGLTKGGIQMHQQWYTRPEWNSPIRRIGTNHADGSVVHMYFPGHEPRSTHSSW
jgi:hypothetical protein